MDPEREHEVVGALVRGAGLLLAIFLAVGLGTVLFVKVLGLDGGGSGSGAPTAQPVSPLPTTALPVKSKKPKPYHGAAGGGGPAQPSGKPQLTASPTQAHSLERVNLTGQYPGVDGVTLQVQRNEGSGWTDFPVNASVHGGSFQTYIMTSHSGTQQFRVYDQQNDKASNPVQVTIQ